MIKSGLSLSKGSVPPRVKRVVKYWSHFDIKTGFSKSNTEKTTKRRATYFSSYFQI
jgi:hypothetical protein